MRSKVLLRDLTIEDVEDRYHWSLDQEVTKYLSFPDKYPPFTKQQTLDWIKICMSYKNGYLQKAVLTEDGRHIGWVDLKNIDQTNKNAELGIVIGDKRYWGKGYGISALKAMLDVGFTKLGLEKIWLRVDYDNTNAIKCYEKCGFVKEGMMRKDRIRKGESINRYRFSILREGFIK